jgi:hypothetical protein
VKISEYVGFLGGLKKVFEDGIETFSYYNFETEMVFHVATQMPFIEDDL